MHADSPFALPAPDADAAAHSERLVEVIAAAVREAGGFVPFDAYMQLALYAPGLGYYAAGATKFGAAGDFTTAPETSALFGACLARQAAEVLGDLGGGEILEYGAGSGALAASVLEQLPGKVRYRILEPSPDLAARQQARLAALPEAVRAGVEWVSEPPPDFRGVVIANEVMDALPVARFEITAGAGAARVAEIGVTVGTDGALELARSPARPELLAAFAAVEADLPAPLPVGYRSEICLTLDGWVRTVCAGVTAGAVLLIDYGLPRAELYLPERASGTLLCHYRHRAHEDALWWPGLNDITAWVDFSAAAAAGDAAGMQLAGYSTQAAFMLGCGMASLYDAQFAAQDDPARAAALAAQARQLLMPGEMGERFRVLGLSRGLTAPLCGFSERDLATRL